MFSEVEGEESGNLIINVGQWKDWAVKDLPRATRCKFGEKGFTSKHASKMHATMVRAACIAYEEYLKQRLAPGVPEEPTACDVLVAFKPGGGEGGGDAAAGHQRRHAPVQGKDTKLGKAFSDKIDKVDEFLNVVLTKKFLRAALCVWLVAGALHPRFQELPFDICAVLGGRWGQGLQLAGARMASAWDHTVESFWGAAHYLVGEEQVVIPTSHEVPAAVLQTDPPAPQNHEPSRPLQVVGALACRTSSVLTQISWVTQGFLAGAVTTVLVVLGSIKQG